MGFAMRDGEELRDVFKAPELEPGGGLSKKDRPPPLPGPVAEQRQGPPAPAAASAAALGHWAGGEPGAGEEAQEPYPRLSNRTLEDRNAWKALSPEERLEQSKQYLLGNDALSADYKKYMQEHPNFSPGRHGENVPPRFARLQLDKYTSAYEQDNGGLQVAEDEAMKYKSQARRNFFAQHPGVGPDDKEYQQAFEFSYSWVNFITGPEPKKPKPTDEPG